MPELRPEIELLLTVSHGCGNGLFTLIFSGITSKTSSAFPASSSSIAPRSGMLRDTIDLVVTDLVVVILLIVLCNG